MASSYLNDSKKLLPCAAYLNGEYGIKDIFAGVPVIIGKNGVEKVDEIELDGKESKRIFKLNISSKKIMGSSYKKLIHLC